MKKLVLLVGMVVLSISAFAQNRGDMYVLTSVSGSVGKLTSNIYNGTFINTEEKSMDNYIGLQVAYGAFVAKNFRLEIDFGGFYEKDLREKSGGSWLNDIYKSFNVCPNLSYYVKLADKFYYTPEIGVDVVFGKYSYEKTLSTTWEFPYRGFSIYANLLAFSYRVGPHFALTVNVGELAHTYRSYYDEGTVFYSGGSTYFRMNNGSIGAQFYF